MTRATCNACGKEIGSKATTCPNCGARAGAKPWTVALALALGVVLVVVLYRGNHPDPNPVFASSSLEDVAEPVDPIALRPHWRYSEPLDDMGGANYRLARVDSVNEVSFHFPYGGAQRGTLTLQKSPDSSNDVLFRIERGQLICPVDDCQISVRFGDGAIESFTLSEPADHSSTVRFIKNYSRFLNHLRKVDTVRIQPVVFENGSPAFEFDVSGLVWK